MKNLENLILPTAIGACICFGLASYVEKEGHGGFIWIFGGLGIAWTITLFTIIGVLIHKATKHSPTEE